MLQVAVFGNGAAGYGNAFCCEHLLESGIRMRVLWVFCFNQFTQSGLYRFRRNPIQSGGEEMPQFIYPEAAFQEFAIHRTGDGGNVQTGGIGYLFHFQGAENRWTLQEKVSLVLYNGLSYMQNGMLSLGYGLDKLAPFAEATGKIPPHFRLVSTLGHHFPVFG